MKRIFIHAFTAGNLGDDLMVRILCERYPKVRFYLCADESYHERYADIKNLSVYAPSDRKTRLLNKYLPKLPKHIPNVWNYLIARADAAVHIGGSVFTQHFDDFSSFYQVDENLLRCSQNLFVIGANFGPYTDPEYYKAYRRLFPSYAGISFRDRFSSELFSDLPNVRYAPDVVFNYRPSGTAAEKKQVAFSVIEMESRGGKYGISEYADSYRSFTAALMKKYIRLGYEIQLVSFCNRQGDDREIQALVSEMSPEERSSVHTFLYTTNLEECLRIFRESEIVVGTRFHSIVLGMLFRKKLIPIIYDSKTTHFLDDLQYKEYLTLDALKNTDIDALVEKTEHSAPISVSALVRDAQNQFSFLDSFLNR